MGRRWPEAAAAAVAADRRGEEDTAEVPVAARAAAKATETEEGVRVAAADATCTRHSNRSETVSTSRQG